MIRQWVVNKTTDLIRCHGHVDFSNDIDSETEEIIEKEWDGQIDPTHEYTWDRENEEPVKGDLIV